MKHTKYTEKLQVLKLKVVPLELFIPKMVLLEQLLENSC